MSLLNSPYFSTLESNIPPLPAGSQLVYVLVDSVDLATTFGAVNEVDETNNLATAIAPTITNMKTFSTTFYGRYTPDWPVCLQNNGM